MAGSRATGMATANVQHCCLSPRLRFKSFKFGFPRVAAGSLSRLRLATSARGALSTGMSPPLCRRTRPAAAPDREYQVIANPSSDLRPGLPEAAWGYLALPGSPATACTASGSGAPAPARPARLPPAVRDAPKSLAGLPVVGCPQWLLLPASESVALKLAALLLLRRFPGLLTSGSV